MDGNASPSSVDVGSLISHPYAVVDAAFAGVRGAAPGSTAFVEEVYAAFSAAFASNEAVSKVPLVTGPAYHQGRLGNATLARGVFMVQDVFDPELQPASYSLRDSVTGGVKVVTSSFRDSMPAHSEPGEGYTERTTLLCVPLPAESAWLSELSNSAAGGARFPSGTASGRKRALGEASEGGEGGGSAPTPHPPAPGALAPQHTGVPSPSAFSGVGMGGGEGGSADGRMAARVRAAAHAARAFIHPASKDSSATTLPCPPVLVRVYGLRGEGGGYECPFRPGDAIEVIGIHTLDSDLYAVGSGLGQDDAGEGQGEEGRMDEGDGEGQTSSGQARGPKRHAPAGGVSGDAMEESLVGGMGVGGNSVLPVTGMLLEEVLVEEHAAKEPPSSVAPRLHAVAVRPVSVGYPAVDLGEVTVSGVRPWGFRSPVVQYTAVPEPGGGTPSSPPSAPSPGEDPLLARGRASLAAQASERKARERAGVASRLALGMAAGGSLTALGSGLAGLGPPASGMLPGAALAELRAGIVSVLSTCLGGDRLAGEYTLLWALSGTGAYGRRDSLEAALGRFSLTLAGYPDHPQGVRLKAGKVLPHPSLPGGPTPVPLEPCDFDAPSPVGAGASPAAQLLQSTIETLAPAAVLIPLRLDLLNGVPFVPVKDHRTGRVMPGLLQLSPGTLITIDETTLSEGKLESSGVVSLSALQSVAGGGELPYDFGFGHVAKFETDTPVLVLSPAAGKSLLRTDAVVRLDASAQAALAAGLPGVAHEASSIPAHHVWHARTFFAAARALPYALPQSLSEVVSSDLASMFDGYEGDKGEAYNRILHLARLAAISHGEAALTLERWAYVKALEAARIARLPPPGGAGGAPGTGRGSEPRTPVRNMAP